MTLEEQVAEFLASIRNERGLSAATAAAYRRDLRQYLAFLAGREPDPHEVAGFVAHLLERGLAPSSIGRKVAAVRGLHRFLVVDYS